MRRRGKGGGSVFYHEGKGKWVAQLTWIDPATGRKVKREKCTRAVHKRNIAPGPPQPIRWKGSRDWAHLSIR